MQLSIIIVSYNVRYFLEQCLLSVQKAVRGIDAELIVVDNHSGDGSLEFLEPLFPAVRFIANSANIGFAKACNQGLAASSGRYILFLNPDTLVPEDCLEKCLEFIHTRPDAGAIGLRMLDGKGRFLPESKRSFPSLRASFFKLMGLAALFPSSRLFNAYALGYLNASEDHEVEVLAGAFLLARRQVLDTLGGFDENFFLYGEDIDLSFRIRKAGYRNFYFAGSQIIHFKGESSSAAPLDHTRFFYRAMLTFVQKHYRSRLAKQFGWLLGMAIALRGSLAFLSRLLKPVLLPLIDLALLWLSMQAMRGIWVREFRNGIDFHVAFVPYALPILSLVFVMAAALAGLYDMLYKTSRSLVAVLFGALAVLAVYSILPESVRFSRGVVLCGALLGALLIIWFRQSLFTSLARWMGYEKELKGAIAVVGDPAEYAIVRSLLDEAMLRNVPLLRISPLHAGSDTIGTFDRLPIVCREHDVEELVCCEGLLPLSAIIERLASLQDEQIRPLFYLSGAHSLIGSDLPSQRGRSISVFSDYRLANPYQRRMKRVTDVLMAVALIVTTPVHFFFHPHPVALLKNCWLVLRGQRSWVGYRDQDTKLPPLRKGIIFPAVNPDNAIPEADAYYAKNYDWWQDLLIIVRSYRRLA